ncbi:MAG: DUF4236 domain-containing protein [Anaerolineaceae bacterium]|jgi:hypothetical protein|nr:DUF4236 domain-containing protein [Anaerolineaceae bacterium]
MGLRFRKSINLGKFFRINISKSGIGTSSGVKGFRVSRGPRGTRTTVSIPGTGVSYVKETRKSSAKIKPTGTQIPSLSTNKRTCGIIAIVVTTLLGLCGVGGLIVSALGGGGEPTLNVDQAVNQIYSTMTMEAAVRSRQLELTRQAPTVDQQSTETPEPIPTLAPVQANTLAPSSTPFPTNTPVILLPTQPPPPPPQPAAVCDCSRDYNCSDFSTHSAAQACYESCGGNNWSGLDNNKNGIACESLQ